LSDQAKVSRQYRTGKIAAEILLKHGDMNTSADLIREVREEA
jgi:hypothetical protein